MDVIKNFNRKWMDAIKNFNRKSWNLTHWGRVTHISVSKACHHWPQCINSLWPSDTIWWQRSGSTLAPVMDCCQTAPNHYLNHCWLIINNVLWHSSEGIIMRRSEDVGPVGEGFAAGRHFWMHFLKCIFFCILIQISRISFFFYQGFNW